MDAALVYGPKQENTSRREKETVLETEAILLPSKVSMEGFPIHERERFKIWVQAGSPAGTAALPLKLCEVAPGIEVWTGSKDTGHAGWLTSKLLTLREIFSSRMFLQWPKNVIFVLFASARLLPLPPRGLALVA